MFEGSINNNKNSSLLPFFAFYWWNFSNIYQ